LDLDLDATTPDFTAAASSDQSGVCGWLRTELARLNQHGIRIQSNHFASEVLDQIFSIA
jgi:hypothetical protein